MQQIEPWRKQLRYLERHYDDSEIAAMCGVTRQAVNKWHSAVRGPQERHKKGLERAYNLALEQRARLTYLVDIAEDRMKRYGDQWPGNNTLEFELEMWPEQFVKARLPWLVSDHFYHDGYNRRGDYLEPFSVPNYAGYGWADLDAQKDFKCRYAL